MQTKQKAGTFLAGALIVCGVLAGCDQMGENSNGEVQSHSENWRSLFDGETLSGWSGVNGKKIGDAWQVIDGNLVLTAGGAGDIVTRDQFEDFELQLEWKISKKGNSGIFYRVADEDAPAWTSGMEYQLLDDANYPDLEKSSHAAGSVFDLYTPTVKAVKPAGEFNQSRIRIKNGHVEHWLNGQRIVSYKLWSDDWKNRFEKSKFSDYEKYGREKRGHIALQDHGDKVWYKNIKIQEL